VIPDSAIIFSEIKYVCMKVETMILLSLIVLDIGIALSCSCCLMLCSKRKCGISVLKIHMSIYIYQDLDKV